MDKLYTIFKVRFARGVRAKGEGMIR